MKLYDREVEVIQSAVENKETYCVAGNKLGKDFVSGFIAPACFYICLCRNVSCRIITTSVAEHHLAVLWGEIGRFLGSSKVPLLRTSRTPNAPLIMDHQRVRRADEREDASGNTLNYLVGRVSAKGEGLAGHHAQFTMIIGDEASGLDDACYTMAQGWAKHMLWIGNPNNCDNFFKRGVKGGDLMDQREVA